MHRSIIASGIAAVCWMALPTGIEAQEISLGEGAQVYAGSCSRCHNARAPSERSDREWDVIVAHMRTRGNLTGREARAVLHFLQSTNASEGGSGPVQATSTGQGDEGEKLVVEKGCIACHKIGKHASGTVGPDLNTVLTRRDSAYVLKKLAEPAFDNPSSLMPQLNLTPEERDAILAYLTSVSRK